MPLKTASGSEIAFRGKALPVHKFGCLDESAVLSQKIARVSVPSFAYQGLHSFLDAPVILQK